MKLDTGNKSNLPAKILFPQLFLLHLPRFVELDVLVSYTLLYMSPIKYGPCFKSPNGWVLAAVTTSPQALFHTLESHMGMKYE